MMCCETANVQTVQQLWHIFPVWFISMCFYICAECQDKGSGLSQERGSKLLPREFRQLTSAGINLTKSGRQSLGLLSSRGFIYSRMNHFCSRLCNLNLAACVSYLNITNMAAGFLNPFLAKAFVLLQVCRSEKSVLPVYSGCLDLDAHFYEHNVKLASVYIECRL